MTGCRTFEVSHLQGDHRKRWEIFWGGLPTRGSVPEPGEGGACEGLLDILLYFPGNSCTAFDAPTQNDPLPFPSVRHLFLDFRTRETAETLMGAAKIFPGKKHFPGFYWVFWGHCEDLGSMFVYSNARTRIVILWARLGSMLTVIDIWTKFFIIHPFLYAHWP